jgi:hypothetical protein
MYWIECRGQYWPADQFQGLQNLPVGGDPAIPGKERVMERRRFKQVVPLDQRLAQHAQQLRKEAKGLPPGGEREKLIRKARQLETASDVSHWLDKGHPG